MSKDKLTEYTVKLFKKRNQLRELEKLKENVEVPQRPDKEVSIPEHDRYKYEKNKYDIQLEGIDKKLAEISKEISDLENKIKESIEKNTTVRLSSEDEDRQYNLIVEHVHNDKTDRIDLSEQ